MIANDKTSEDYVQLHKMLFNPFGLYESGYIDKTVRGATRTQMSKPGNSMSPEVLKIAIFLVKTHNICLSRSCSSKETYLSLKLAPAVLTW
jgi:hypothetical protein